MEFLNRRDELDRLLSLAQRDEGGLAVLYGRRRVGKTRLLLEWAHRTGGVYFVADLSTPELQRTYLANALERVFPGFSEVTYPSWAALFSRIARELERDASFRGPIILDELPYLAQTSPELPSVIQRWLDHELLPRGGVLALAGSSQRMMQGLVLQREAPLFGRAHVSLCLQPMPFHCLGQAIKVHRAVDLLSHHAAWGGVPRYWELARTEQGRAETRIERLVLDPLGPLHREPDLLLLEETPPAIELRPILDVIGGGAHRISEIASRAGYKATSLSRPLNRLVEMGLVRREVPFGEDERRSKRSLYRIDDPFLRLWFRVVAPHQSLLASASRPVRAGLLSRYWPGLVSEAWEALCRSLLPHLQRPLAGRAGPWGPAGRWWQGQRPEWDVVCRSVDGEVLLLGEVKWRDRPFTFPAVRRLCKTLREREAPSLTNHTPRAEVRALFVPEAAADVPDTVDGVAVVQLGELLPGREG